MASPGDKKGQRWGSCGHVMASFDMHDKCARCRDKLIGEDKCVLKKPCAVCDGFLCQLTCQSAGIMSSLCGVGVRVRVRVNNFSSKTTRPRDVLFFLKDTLSIEDEKLFKACKSVCSSVC